MRWNITEALLKMPECFSSSNGSGEDQYSGAFRVQRRLAIDIRYPQSVSITKQAG